jgi:hypothetical protein
MDVHLSIEIEGEGWAATFPALSFTPEYIISKAGFEAARAAERALERT